MDGAYKTLAPPPRIVPIRRAMNGSSDVTGPHLRCSANWIGMADRHLAKINIHAT